MARRMLPGLVEGHGPSEIHANIRILVGEGYSQAAACNIALAHARKAYRQEFAKGAFPAHMRKKRKAKKNKWVEEIF